MQNHYESSDKFLAEHILTIKDTCVSVLCEMDYKDFRRVSYIEISITTKIDGLWKLLTVVFAVCDEMPMIRDYQLLSEPLEKHLELVDNYKLTLVSELDKDTIEKFVIVE